MSALPAPGRIDKPGCYDMPAEDYHADPVCEPSLSSSIAVKLLDQSPRHAWTAHPRLNPRFAPEDKTQFDLGKAAHALLLEGDDSAVVIDADSYRTKDAKAQRDAAYEAGKTPILAEKWEDVRRMVDAARAQLDATEGCQGVFEGGKAEQTLIWQEDGVWCRARLDWTAGDGTEVIWDYKSTGGSAQPDAWAKNQLFEGRELQVGLYTRGAMSVFGWKRPRFVFVVQENQPPYALSVVDLQPAGLVYAERRTSKAIDLWRRCLQSNRWPGYPSVIASVEPPPWAVGRWDDRIALEEIIEDRGQDPFNLMIDWQAPLEAVK